MTPKVEVPRWVAIWRLIKLIHSLSLLVFAKVPLDYFIHSSNITTMQSKMHIATLIKWYKQG